MAKDSMEQLRNILKKVEAEANDIFVKQGYLTVNQVSDMIDQMIRGNVDTITNKDFIFEEEDEV